MSDVVEESPTPTENEDMAKMAALFGKSCQTS